MKKLKISVAILLILAMMVPLAACNNNGAQTSTPPGGSSTQPSGDPGSNASTQPGTSTRDTLVIGLEGEPSSFVPWIAADPTSDAFISNVYDPLVRRNNQGQIVPSLAESWTLADDKMSFDFKIRQGVKFHNGYDLTADDVVFSVYQASIAPAKSFFGAICAEVEKIDETTVRIHMAYPEQAFLQYLARITAIGSKQYYDEVGEATFAAEPVGTGAYKLVDWQKGYKILLESYDDYFMGPAPIKNIEIQIIMDSNTRLAALETGQVDLIYSPTGLQKEQILKNSALGYSEQQGEIFSYIGFNVTRPPFDNVKVRRALAMSVNRDDIITGAFDGLAYPLRVYLAPQTQGNPGEDTLDLLPFDIERAKAELVDAGFPNGLDITFSCTEGSRKVATILQDQWKQIGVNCSVNIVEGGAIMSDIRNGVLDCFYFGGMDQTNDATILLDFLTEKGIGILNNFMYINPRYDELFEKQTLEWDPVKRKEIVKEMLNIYAQDVPLIPTHLLISNMAYNKDLNIMIDTSFLGVMFREFSWKS